MLGIFMNSISINEIADTFKKLVKVTFKPQAVLKIPILHYFFKLLVLYLTDGLYLSRNIKTVLK